MIIIAGHLRVVAAERGRYLTKVADVAVQARRTPGCPDYVQSADPIRQERINIFERWDSDEVLTSYRNSGGDEADWLWRVGRSDGMVELPLVDQMASASCSNAAGSR